MKCDICGNKIETTFLRKIVGTYVKRGKKKKSVCPNCQKTLKNDIVDKLPL
ncbi:hypothetical protein K9M79_00945 [Candidatus Woesearchaeota archaeon]|nr:hypothetical protein [Candidatus Woesearchaeota archaeon]